MDNAFKKDKTPSTTVYVPNVFCPFEPATHVKGESICHHGHHCDEPITFMNGRYIDIANTKHKNPNTLYFGTSLSTNKLSGIFLGDTEITSRVKDVSLFTSSTPGINELIVTFINSKNKLLSIKTTFATLTGIDNLRSEIIDIINDTVYPIDSSIIDRIINVDTSIMDIIDRIETIDSSIELMDSSINDIYDRLDVIDSSYNDLINQLEDGKYNYTVKLETSDFYEGFKKSYSLFKGENEQSLSEKIEIIDILPKEINYDSSVNKINIISWPKDINEKGLAEITGYDSEGNPIIKTNPQLNPDLIHSISLDMDPFVDYIDIFMNTSSLLNERVEVNEYELTWQNLI